jgi:hypothetical protein
MADDLKVVCKQCGGSGRVQSNGDKDACGDCAGTGYLTIFAGGAKRSSRKAPHFLSPLELSEAVAWTRYSGDAKYGVGNWHNGDKEFFVDCLSHSIQHLMEAPYEEEEDFWTHLGHAACNIGFMLWALKRGIVTAQDYRDACKVLKPLSR